MTFDNHIDAPQVIYLFHYDTIITLRIHFSPITVQTIKQKQNHQYVACSAVQQWGFTGHNSDLYQYFVPLTVSPELYDF